MLISTVKIRLLKAIDMLCGGVAVNLLSPPPFVQTGFRCSSILIIRPGGIGDAVHLIPVLQFLKLNFPDVSIDILAERRNAALFSLSSHVHSVFCYDVPKELRTAFRERYDVVIDTEQWHRLSAVVARLISADVRIGFGINERSRLFNYPVAYSHDDYEVVSFLRLLEPLGIHAPSAVTAPWLTVPVRAREKADELLNGLNNKSFVTIFPGASIPERRWGADRFRSVAQLLAKEHIPTVVVGGAEDAVEGEEIVKGVHGVNLAGKTSLAETAAIIECSSVLLSGDSGILHIGVGLGIPTVSLFGPGIAAKWAPRGDTHIVINKHRSCSPCTRFGTTPTCKTGAHCIADISPDEVYAAVVSLLERKTH